METVFPSPMPRTRLTMRLLIVPFVAMACAGSEDAPAEYGVDVSFPMQHRQCHDGPLGDKQAEYERFVQGCVDFYGEDGDRCLTYERDRIHLALEQPRSMKNYTASGFKKIRCPEALFRVVKEFWETNKHRTELGEDEPLGYTYINTWDVRTELVSLYDTANVGGGQPVLDAITEATRDVLQEWTGEDLKSVSTYGIRIYKEGHILATHADRVPLVTSAIINVDQDVDEPWPLEVYGHDGRATNVTMLPGDMVLYESHSVLHGRPFPLKGRMFANVFVHFEPTGKPLREESMLRQLYRAAEQRKATRENEAYIEMPSYLLPGTPEADRWLQNHLVEESRRQYKILDRNEFRKVESAEQAEDEGTRAVHSAAQLGDLAVLTRLIEDDPSLVRARDDNGWLAVHEAARYGKFECLKYLHENGADINAVSGLGGGTPLYWAIDNHGADHPVTHYLESKGALNRGP